MGSCKRFIDYLIAFLNKSLTCDQAVLLPICLEDKGKGTLDLFTLRVVCP